jgi:transglutaminase-like putative cysteine protease
LITRALLIAGVLQFEFSPKFVNAATVAYAAFYGIDYLYLSRSFLSATVHLVFFLAIMRILTARTNRDYFFVKLIAFLELLAATLLSASANFFVFLALFLLFGVATFCSSEIRSSARKGRLTRNFRMFHFRLAALSLSVSLGILIMTAGLFFLLPRTARAAFQHLVSERYHLPGFSNEVTLGQIGEIKQQSTTIMHARIEDVDHFMPLKWRGGALSEFDGTRWFNRITPGEVLRVERGQLRMANLRQEWRRGGRRINYEVNIKALDSDALFFPGVPEHLRIHLSLIVRTPVDSFLTRLGASDGIHYFGVSHLPEEEDTFEAPPLSPSDFAMYTQLTPHDPRIDALAHDLTVRVPGQREKARAIESYLRTKFGYTTELLKEPVPDPLAHFLFERRKGHCEYFASAMAVMLRTVHIPSRVATGFQSGVFNPLTGWHVIRAMDAHSWVEAYLPGRGWITFDPTPPDYSQATSATSALLRTLALYLDAADTFWNEWVLNYDRDRQVSLASRVESSSRMMSLNWWDRLRDRAKNAADTAVKEGERYFAYGLLIAGLGVFLVLYGPLIWKWWQTQQRVRRFQRGHGTPSDAALLYGRMLSMLRRRGYEKPAWLTPAEFARVMPEGPGSQLVTEITTAYNELRFGGSKDAGVRMLRLLKELESTR